jgi:tetratricopeptide (TPR) repeat protein
MAHLLLPTETMMAPRVGVLAVLLAVAPAAVGQTVPGGAAAEEALDLCLAVERASGEERIALVERGLALAEAAVAADDNDARAHLALFCTLGRQVELHPLGLGSLTSIRRVRREADRALELAPRSVEALTGKGSLLAELPGFLGGDLEEAERLLRRAIALDRGAARAHLALARVLAARDARDEAREAAKQALAAAATRPGSLDGKNAEALLGHLAQR